MNKNYSLKKSTLAGFFFIFFILFAERISSQNVGINSGGTTPNTSAILDLNTGNTFTNPNGKGLLIPNVALTATNASNPVTSPSTSLLVYNTATASSGSTAVFPGYYYWDGAKWVAFTGPNSNDWSLTGNAGTVIGTNFLGTTDNVDLQFRANNLRSGLIGIASFNTLFGYAAGLNSTGIINSYFGYGSGQTNTTGTGNTGVGYYSLLLNNTGTDNTAVGVQSLYNATGSNNIALGTNAGYSISSGTGNTALGFWAINNGSNTTTGTYNTAVGYHSSQSLVGGGFNTSVGFSTLVNNTAGSANTGIGTDALYYMGTSYNTSIGTYALEGSATVASNTGLANTAIGFCAGSGYSAYPVGGGTNNSKPLTTGSYNTFVGYGSAMTAGTYSNTTTIGSFAEAGASDVLILGSISGTNNAPNNTNVGIGTTTPSYLFHVVGSTASDVARVENSNGAGNGLYGYNTTGGVGAGLYGNCAASSGTTFAIATVRASVKGYGYAAGNYAFGVYGNGGSSNRSGGVLGYNYGNSGCLGYFSAGGTNYTVYGFGTAYFTGLATGRAANTNNTGIVPNLDVNNTVGLGIYGGVMGGWIRGLA